jgi:hypothetical protein
MRTFPQKLAVIAATRPGCAPRQVSRAAQAKRLQLLSSDGLGTIRWVARRSAAPSLLVNLCIARGRHAKGEARTMIVAVVLTALLFWVAIFLVFFSSEGTSPFDSLLGTYEPLPADLGQWRIVGPDAASGFVREERFLLPGASSRASYLLRQVRLRDATSGAVHEVEPETRVPRRRGRGS